MKLNKNNSTSTLYKKIFKKFILTVIIFIIAIPILIFAVARIISMFNFEWVYNISPAFYYRTLYMYEYFFAYDYYIIFSIFLAISIILISILLFKQIKKVFSYVTDLDNASKQLLNKNIDYIKLPPELSEINFKLNHLKHEAEQNERLVKEAEQRKNDLIMYLAHDLKTPLTSIIGYLELLKESPDIPLGQRIKYTNISLDKAYRLEELMNEFFEIARFNNTNIILMKQKLNLKFMLEQIVDEFFPITNEQNKNIIINCDDEIICFADPDKLSRAFNNVIKNAISYSFEESNIDINVTKNNDLIKVSIQNKGATIPENKLNSIFEKFYRLDNSRNTKNGGSGLGLAIAKEIIELHGGNISAKSKNNITTFIITIPENIPN